MLGKNYDGIYPSMKFLSLVCLVTYVSQAEADCSEDCFGYDCDYWSGLNFGFSCSILRDYDCDCSGCDCPADECAPSCNGYTCEEWEDIGYSCDIVEDQGCDCAGCSCAVLETTSPPEELCPTSSKGNGLCDSHTEYKICNTAAFEYDGGDCCASTCSGKYCGYHVYDCQDPLATNIGYCTISWHPSALGDGFCDSWGAYNTEACSWDGGDCCPDTCVDADTDENQDNSDR